MTSPTEITLRRVLVGHRAAVNVVDFDEKYIVSASGDRTIKVWNTSTCEFVRTLNGHKRGIACLQYRDRLVVSGSSDNSIRWISSKITSYHLHEHVNYFLLFTIQIMGYWVWCLFASPRRTWGVSSVYTFRFKTHCQWGLWWENQGVGFGSGLGSTRTSQFIMPENISGTSMIRKKSSNSFGLPIDLFEWCALISCSIQEHTGRVFRLQFDEFQIVSSSHDDTILIWDFLNYTPPERIESPRSPSRKCLCSIRNLPFLLFSLIL